MKGKKNRELKGKKREEKNIINCSRTFFFRPSSVEYASKLLGSNASSYLSPSSMSDTENNNNHDKLEDSRQPSSPVRFGGGNGNSSRKRPASTELDGDDIIEEESEEEALHFKRRHPSTDMSDRFDYLSHNSSGNSASAAAAAAAAATSSADSDLMSPSSGGGGNNIKEELSLRDISMLRNNPEDSRSIKREKY